MWEEMRLWTIGMVKEERSISEAEQCSNYLRVEMPQTLIFSLYIQALLYLKATMRESTSSTQRIALLFYKQGEPAEK